MKVSEIFPSLQGEGLLMGLPTTFIRFTGCNLRCNWCDTKYSYEDGDEVSVADIVKAVEDIGIKRVCLTGGEPLLQKELADLLEALDGYEQSIETNGSLDISALSFEGGPMISLDMKCPSSGMTQNNRLENLGLLKQSDQLKFVILDEKDYDYAKGLLVKYSPPCPVVFTPVDGIDGLDELAELVLRDGLTGVRVLPQLHKLVWPEEERGR